MFYYLHYDEHAVQCNAIDFLRQLFSDLSENYKLSTIPFDSIKKLSNLLKLTILHTNITTIPDYAFKGLNNLETL